MKRDAGHTWRGSDPSGERLHAAGRPSHMRSKQLIRARGGCREALRDWSCRVETLSAREPPWRGLDTGSPILRAYGHGALLT